jgi:hypothetical protein
MIEEGKAIVAQLNSPSDWAIVGGAAVLGLVLDGAINIIPLPFFSPGVCALTAAGATLSAKRGAEALSARKSLAKRHVTLSREAQRCLSELGSRGESVAVDELSWRLRLDGGNTESLEAIVRDARDSLRDPATSNTSPQSIGIPLTPSISDLDSFSILRDGLLDLGGKF